MAKTAGLYYTASLLACLLSAPAQACAPPVPASMVKSINLKDSAAAIVTVEAVHADAIEHCGADSAVRGTFVVEAEAADEALSSGGKKTYMIFVFDRAKAEKFGCELHQEILFKIPLYDDTIPGKHQATFGYPAEDGSGRMRLGTYHEMMRRGCVAAHLNQETQ